MRDNLRNGWTIANKIGTGNFGTVYKAINKDGYICAVKYISLSKDKATISNLKDKGLLKNDSDIDKYYNQVIAKVKNEIAVMQKFNGNCYIIDCYDFFAEAKNNNEGQDIYIRMEYATDLNKKYQNQEISYEEVIKLGIEICSSLELCAKEGIIHNDIKPSNIFIGKDNHYKLGDFGVATNLEEYNALSFGTTNYMSPESYKKEKITEKSDLYSLGLVMYKLLNGNLPYVSKKVSEKEALKIRMSAKELPTIKNVPKKLMDIIKKACSLSPDDRYTNAVEMKKALETVNKELVEKNNKVKYVKDEYEDTVGIFDTKTLNKVNNRRVRSNGKIVTFFRKINSLRYRSLLYFGASLILVLSIRAYMVNRNCGTGYVNKGGFCVAGYYYCNEGYSLNSKNKCQKTLESEEAKLSYSCPKDYTLNGEVCVSNDVRDPEFVYKCADGFTLNGTKCEREESADAAVTYSCPKNYVLVGQECLTVTNVTPSVSYSCPDSSYTLSGTTCIKNGTSKVKASINYSCDSGGTLSGSTCNYTSEPSHNWGYYYPSCSQGTYNYYDRKCHYTKSANMNYYCSQGTYDGNGYCIVAANSSSAATKKSTCPSGYELVGNQCAKTAGIKATPKYICTDDTELRGSKCYASITTDAVGMYGCDDGFVASGTKCYKNDFPNATKKYTCSKVYTLNGDKCEKYEIISAKIHYNN